MRHETRDMRGNEKKNGKKRKVVCFSVLFRVLFSLFLLLLIVDHDSDSNLGEFNHSKSITREISKNNSIPDPGDGNDSIERDDLLFDLLELTNGFGDEKESNTSQEINSCSEVMREKAVNDPKENLWLSISNQASCKSCFLIFPCF